MNNLILIKLKSSMKKMIKIAFVAAFAAIAGYGVYANQKTDVMSDLALANIEALADGGEGSGDCYGCAIYAIGICKDWGWGGCKGQSLIHYV